MMNKAKKKKRRVLLPLMSLTQLMMSLFLIGSANEVAGGSGAFWTDCPVTNMNIEYLND